MPKKLKLLIVLLIALFSINVYAEEEVQETTTEETPVLISPVPKTVLRLGTLVSCILTKLLCNTELSLTVSLLIIVSPTKV